MDQVTFIWINIDAVIPNPWNPNIQSEEMFANTVASICSEGFIDPVTVRSMDGGQVQILDGEHRWKALIHIIENRDDLPEDVAALFDANILLSDMLNKNVIPAISLGEVDEDQARRITLQLNGIHGEAAPDKLKSLLRNLKEHSSLNELTTRLPMSQERLSELLGVLKEKPSPLAAPSEPPDKWITYKCTFPLATQDIIDSEFDRIGELLGYDTLELTDVQRGLILEKICVLSGDTPTESLE